MSDDPQDIYSSYIDYAKDDLDIEGTVPEHVAVQRNAGKNFQMYKRSLMEVLEKPEFVVPEYQRLYSWEEEQHRELWSDLKKLVGISGRARKIYLMSSSARYISLMTERRGVTRSLTDNSASLRYTSSSE